MRKLDEDDSYNDNYDLFDFRLASERREGDIAFWGGLATIFAVPAAVALALWAGQQKANLQADLPRHAKNENINNEIDFDREGQGGFGIGIDSDKRASMQTDGGLQRVYSPDHPDFLADITLPDSIPDGIEKTLKITFNNLGDDIVKTSAMSPPEFIDWLYDSQGAQIILVGDTSHPSIGIHREFAGLIDKTSANHISVECYEEDQREYDAFARAIQTGLNPDSITKFRERVEANDGHAPSYNLRSKFFDSEYSIYENTAKKNANLQFVDTPDFSGPAQSAENRKIRIASSFQVLERLLTTQNLLYEDVLKPVKGHLHNFIAFTNPDPNLRSKGVDAENTLIGILDNYERAPEETRLALLNITKNTLQSYLVDYDQVPENWETEKIDYSSQIDFSDLQNRVDRVLVTLNATIERLEDERDDKRNRYMVDNIVDTYRASNTKTYRGLVMIGQGHFDGARDMDEMLKEALPGVKIVRVDFRPCHSEDLEMIGSQIGKNDFEGTDYTIFTPCPIEDFVSGVDPSP